MYTCCIVIIYESKEVEKGSLMRATVAYPKGWVEETVRESSRCGLLMLTVQQFNCMVVRTLTVLTVSGVRGQTLIWQGRM